MDAACFDDGEVRICQSHVKKTRQVMAELRVYATVDEVGSPSSMQLRSLQLNAPMSHRAQLGTDPLHGWLQRMHHGNPDWVGAVACGRILDAGSVAAIDQVWRVLTDWDRLADFVPNLAHCERIGGAPPGRIWIRQRGCSQVGSLWNGLDLKIRDNLGLGLQPSGKLSAELAIASGGFEGSSAA